MNLFTLPNSPILKDTVPNELYDSLLKEAHQSFDQKTSAHNKKLVGHIKHEYVLKENTRVLNPYIKHLAQYLSANLDKGDKKGYGGNNYILKDLWVNFQKKHEFNPIHVHDGIFSFVIFMTVPYELNDEMKVFNANGDHASRLEFVYSNTLGRIIQYVLDINKSDEKSIVMFPASLNHVVYPFYTSNDYRITISGNVYGE